MGRPRFVESDEALRRRLQYGDTGARSTKDGIFYALRELYPEMGVVIMENPNGISPRITWFDRLFRRWKLRIKAHERAQVTFYLYSPAGLVLDGSNVAQLLREMMPAGVSYHTVFCGGL